MFQYAEQSSRLRAQQVGGNAELLYHAFLPWVNARAAVAFQIVTGEAVTLPATKPVEYSKIAALTYERKGPL